MEPSNVCLEAIQHFEGLPAPDKDGLYHAYHGKADKPGIWTIGYGTTWYPVNGKAVKEGDTATKAQVDEYLAWHVGKTADAINTHLPLGKNILQQQFDAFVSFAYNLGENALLTSTMWKKAMVDLTDPTIFTYLMSGNVPKINTCEFLKWVYSNGQVVDDLIFRRASEANLYKSGIFKPFPGH